MNLLKKDKYRTKIMQHLLCKYENNETQQIKENMQNNRFLEDINSKQNQSQKAYSSMMFKNLSKQKALICDSQDTERKAMRKIKKDNLIDMAEQFKENRQSNHKNPAGQNIKRRINQVKYQEKLSTIQNHSHLGKQKFYYHQKIPMSSGYNQLGQRRKDNKQKQINVKNNRQNKQNSQKNANKTECKQKKYRFITVNKVNQALKTKKQMQIEDQQTNQLKIKNPKMQNQITIFHETQRSRGSKQMMVFLQSARQNLFSNKSNSKSTEQNNQVKQIKLKGQIQSDEAYDKLCFKIQIQISQDKTCAIQLNLDSDPRVIAKQFITQNRKQLVLFKQLQQKKLQELLSNKISIQIEKQKKLKQKKRQQKVQEKYRKIINQMGVSQILLNDDECQQFLNKQNKILVVNSNGKSKRSLKQKQYSHIYIQNIDTLPSNQQVFYSNKKFVPIKVNNQQQDSQFNQQMILFNRPSQQKMIQEDSDEQIQMGGYMNSPHQLITTRQDSHHFQNQHQSSNEQRVIQGNCNDEQISHFPLGKSPVKQEAVRQDLNQSQICIQGFKVIKENHFIGQVGAAKILSKSRKNINKQKVVRQDWSQQKKRKIKPALQKSNKNFIKQPQTHPKYSIESSEKKVPNYSKNSAINTISERIVNRLGKQNIITYVKQKQMSKREQIIKQKQAKEIQLIKQCSFRPKINNLSVYIDQKKNRKMRIDHLINVQEAKNKKQRNNTFRIKNSQLQQLVQFQQDSEQYYMSKNKSKRTQRSNQSQIFGKRSSQLQNSSEGHKGTSRYQSLYENYKTIEEKKQSMRQKSIQQLRFKPQINLISKRIVQTKRNSLNNSVCRDPNNQSSQSMSRHHSTCNKMKEGRKSIYDTYLDGQEQTDGTTLHNKRKSLNSSRNRQGLEIGQYLYKQAMKMKKKKQDMPLSTVQKFKPLGKSEKIINQVKEKRLSQYFDQLINIIADQGIQTQNPSLQPKKINLSEGIFQKQPLKQLIPLLRQIKQLDVSLTRDQFIESGLRLLNYLSQDQRAQFLSRKPDHNNNRDNKQNHQPSINKFSKQLGQKKQYYLQDIYHRGLVYKQHVKDKVQLGVENKVRKQLQKCSFKPKINAEFKTGQ